MLVLTGFRATAFSSGDQFGKRSDPRFRRASVDLVSRFELRHL